MGEKAWGAGARVRARSWSNEGEVMVASVRARTWSNEVKGMGPRVRVWGSRVRG